MPLKRQSQPGQFCSVVKHRFLVRACALVVGVQEARVGHHVPPAHMGQRAFQASMMKSRSSLTLRSTPHIYELRIEIQMEATYSVFKYLVTNHDIMKCVFSSCLDLGYHGLQSRPDLESSDPSDMERAALRCPGPPTEGSLYRHCCPLDPTGSLPWGVQGQPPLVAIHSHLAPFWSLGLCESPF